MKLVHSPLFEPVLWEGRGFKILDETLVPERTQYIRIDQISQAIDAVREMKTRAFGQVLTFLFSGALLAQEYQGNDPVPLRDQLLQMTQRFCAARPTFDFNGLFFFFSKWTADLPAGASVGALVTEQTHGFVRQIVAARLARAKRTASILPNPARVLTHCNVSGELVAVAQLCSAVGKEISVIATETRPYLQGSRLTAWELAQAGISVSLVPDCAIAQVMGRGKVNAVVVGSDRCAQNGDIINKVGTYPLALMARDYDIPFYVLVQDPGELVRGEDVEIEERSADELLVFQGEPLLAEGSDRLAGRYPAFDITPSALITHLIGFDDLFTPESFRQRYLKESTAAPKNRKVTPEKYLLVFGLPKNDSYAFLAHALKAEQAQRILIPEMRPQLWGARVVARELLKRHVPATLISDNMMGTLFVQRQIQQLYLFYSKLTGQGPQGICGSLLAVRLAHAHGVPIELLESEETTEIPADADVSTFLGRKMIPPKVSVYPIEKEILPWALLKQQKDTATMKALEREMIRWGSLLFERRLISGWGGNLSCRVDKNDFLITGQHAPLGFLTPKDLVRINDEGKPAQPEQRASSETPLHLAVYRGTDAEVVVHVHPPMVLAFSLTHESFVPVSFEEKYTIGEVPIIPQDTPTVTRPEPVVEELKYHPVVIIKGHGTVAIGKTLQEAFLLTDLLEEAVHCQFFKDSAVARGAQDSQPTQAKHLTPVSLARDKSYALFSQEHMGALVERANRDSEFRSHGNETSLSTSLTLHLEETDTSWTVKFVAGEITELTQGTNGEFMISGTAEWWKAVFSNRIDPFLATQQGKLKLKRGELAQLSRWYKPFQRAFAIWQTIPAQ